MTGKKLWGIIVASVMVMCLSVYLTSCGVQGGTLSIENGFDTEKDVSIYTGKISGIIIQDAEMHGEGTIPAGATKNFHVDKNSEYHILYFPDIDSNGQYFTVVQKEIKSVRVSGGETVRVTIR